MARTRTFETAAAVAAAREVFWRRGYAETSVPDLEAATGLARSSLYAAFGSKRGLFDAAVASYLEEVVRPRIAALGDDGEDAVAPDALDGYLGGLRDAVAAGADDVRLGCLLVNTAGADLVHDEGVRAVIAGYHRELRGAVVRGLAAARPELDDAARSALAVEIAGLVVSSMVLARVDRDAAVELLESARGRVAA
ncbi:hypothetical protein GCM10022215_42230 [Nocardioides fonticola]|uniref:HTH tetR-type domain-containing protein n=1 Tax=Nocardioides fonticola TaxID=450363 RepID=A0ABP7Y1Y9_9ACTN